MKRKTLLVISGRFKIAIDKKEILQAPDALDILRMHLIDALKRVYFLKEFRESENLPSPYPLDVTITELSQKIVKKKSEKK